jgi:hypothetical protein
MKELLIVRGGNFGVATEIVENMKERGINIVVVDEPPKEVYPYKRMPIFCEPLIIAKDLRNEKYESQTWKPKHKRK